MSFSSPIYQGINISSKLTLIIATKWWRKKKESKRNSWIKLYVKCIKSIYKTHSDVEALSHKYN